MINEPVNDGTQMTPTGSSYCCVIAKRSAVIRVINVISADVDLLAQYAPGQRIRFSLVNHDEAIIAEQKEASLTGANSLANPNNTKDNAKNHLQTFVRLRDGLTRRWSLRRIAVVGFELTTHFTAHYAVVLLYVSLL